MKNYPHICAKVFREPWIITKEKLDAIVAILITHIEASAGDPREDEPKTAEPKKDEKAKEDPFIIEDGTAIIPVHGIIGKHLSRLEMMSGGADLDLINALTDAAQANPEVNRILYDFRSPGGTVTGVPEMGRKMYNSKKKTVAFTDSEANSGALWLATQAHEFYSTSSARVGSIGVWTASMDYSRMLENEGIRVNAISAGKYKLLGAYWKPMTDDERAVLQAKVDGIHSEFKDAVLSRREIDAKYMEGQIFDGIEAINIGLVDGLVDDIAELFD